MTSAVVTEASGLSLSAIRDYAELIGEHHAIYDANGYADVYGLVIDLGGEVEVGEGSETLRVWRPNEFVVNVPLTTSQRRDRFTIAHELGHYFLHYLYAKETAEVVFGRGLSNRAETEANTFASSLLMPTKEFSRAFAEHGGDWYAVARVFDVSPRAAEVRALVLKLR